MEPLENALLTAIRELDAMQAPIVRGPEHRIARNLLAELVMGGRTEGHFRAIVFRSLVCPGCGTIISEARPKAKAKAKRVAPY